MVVLRLLAAHTTLHHFENASYPKKTITLLEMLTTEVQRSIVAEQEPERYVLALALEIQRRMLNAHARLASAVLFSGSGGKTNASSIDGGGAAKINVGSELWQQRWCPHTNASSPM